MNQFLRLIAAVVFMIFTGLAAAATSAEKFGTIAICDDENEWPPYSYWARVDGKKTGNVAGYAVSVIDAIFARHHINYRVELIPWSRCQAVSVLGQQYQMVFNLSYNAERDKHFFLSLPYYSTTAHYYYSRRHNPDGLAINSPADIGKYRVCGIQGYNYAGYGLAPGQVDQGARDFSALISKMHLGRCTLFLEKNEIMKGYAAIGKNYLADHDIGSAPVPGMKPELFFMGISKQFPHAAQLHRLLNRELRQMETDGTLTGLLERANAQAREIK